MNQDNEDLEAKDSLDSSLESKPEEQTTVTAEPNGSDNSLPPPPKKTKVFDGYRKYISRHWSLYLPLFMLFLVLVVISAVIIYNHEHPKTKPIVAQTLTAQALSKLADNSQQVGNSNQVLTIQSSSIFNGQVLIRGQLQVAGQLSVGGSLNLTGIIVSGNSVFSQLQVNKNLTVSGNASVQGSFAVQNDLSVNGSGTFSGPLSAPQLSVNTLQLAGDLTLARHLITSGSIPSHSTTGALGAGGTSSVNGSDTAGTVTFSSGYGPAAGCYINVTFSGNFSSTPHVILTPVGANGATLQYYVNRTSSGFSVCSVNSPLSGQTYVFDYFVID